MYSAYCEHDDGVGEYDCGRVEAEDFYTAAEVYAECCGELNPNHVVTVIGPTGTKMVFWVNVVLGKYRASLEEGYIVV